MGLQFLKLELQLCTELENQVKVLVQARIFLLNLYSNNLLGPKEEDPRFMSHLDKKFSFEVIKNIYKQNYYQLELICKGVQPDFQNLRKIVI